MKKPFVVAYLVPNLNHQDVKDAAIRYMFQSASNLFGGAPSLQQIESRVPESAAIEAADGECFDEYVDGTYRQADEPIEKEKTPVQSDGENQKEWRNDFYCDKCGVSISEKVWDYSVEKYERPLCYKCQKGEKR